MIEEQELAYDPDDQPLTTIRLEVDRSSAAATEAESPPPAEPVDRQDQPDPPAQSTAQGSVEPVSAPLVTSPGHGCIERSLTVFSSVVLALIVMIAVAFLLGYTPWELALLREENAALQAQVADMGRKNREMERLADEFRASNSLIATFAADLSANQTMLVKVATAQAGKDRLQDVQIEELEAGAERINTFLAVLSDIAGQATTSKAGMIATATSTMTAEPTSPALRVTMGPVETVMREVEADTQNPGRTLIEPPAATRTATPTPTAVTTGNE